jgi:hypothetical protein
MRAKRLLSELEGGISRSRGRLAGATSANEYAKIKIGFGANLAFGDYVAQVPRHIDSVRTDQNFEALVGLFNDVARAVDAVTPLTLHRNHLYSFQVIDCQRLKALILKALIAMISLPLNQRTQR